MLLHVYQPLQHAPMSSKHLVLHRVLGPAGVTREQAQVAVNLVASLWAIWWNKFATNMRSLLIAHVLARLVGEIVTHQHNNTQVGSYP